MGVPFFPKEGFAYQLFHDCQRDEGGQREAGPAEGSSSLLRPSHFRHTDMLDKTGNLRLVQKMLGHESILTTQRHLHPELKGVAELFNQRNNENAEVNLRHSGGRIQKEGS